MPSTWRSEDHTPSTTDTPLLHPRGFCESLLNLNAKFWGTGGCIDLETGCKPPDHLWQVQAVQVFAGKLQGCSGAQPEGGNRAASVDLGPAPPLFRQPLSPQPCILTATPKPDYMCLHHLQQTINVSAAPLTTESNAPSQRSAVLSPGPGWPEHLRLGRHLWDSHRGWDHRRPEAILPAAGRSPPENKASTTVRADTRNTMGSRRELAEAARLRTTRPPHPSGPGARPRNSLFSL